MNSGGESSSPLPGSGEYLLKLLQKNPNPNFQNQIQSNGQNLINPPFAPHSYISNPSFQNSDNFERLGLFGDNNNGFNRFGDNLGQNPSFQNSDQIERLGLFGDTNNGFNRFGDNLGNSGGNPSLNGYDFQNSVNSNSSSRNRRVLSGNDADFQNSMNFSNNGNPRGLNGYNFQNSSENYSGSSNISRNARVLSGNESDFRNSMNSNIGSRNARVLSGSDADFHNLMNASENFSRNPRGINGLEADFRNSINLSRNPINGLEANFRNSMNFSEGSNSANYQNSSNSNGNREVYIRHNRVLNGLETDYRNSPINRPLNGLESNYRNMPNSSRNGVDSDFSNFPNHGSRISKAIQPPPGFSKKKNVEKNVDKEKSSSNRKKSGSISPQLDFPPSGSALHSVSGFEIEESLSELHSEIGENGEKLKNGDSEDLDDNVVESLGKEDGSSNKSQKKKRDKEYRSDTRGQRVLAQWMRKSRSMIACRTDIDIFNAPLLSIFDSLVPPEEEKMKQKQLLALLEKLVIKEWPEARLHVYGSCANSFGVKKSDVDICLAMKDADVNKSEILLRLADILEAENFENVQALTHARVPIVKLMDPVTGISCDICINNVLAVVNSKLLRDYAKIDGRLRQLAFIVKHWAKSRGVNETYHGTLSSYAYVLMCIHFLQQCRPSILPCLQGMNITYNVIVDNVECAFFDQVEKLSGFGLRNKENIGQLVWGFFRYWAYCHDYAHDVVSVRVGSTISKRAKDWTRRVGNDRHLICIEDPFETTHDLGRVVDKFSIKVLREEFERAAEILQFDPNPCVTLFEPYVPS